MAGDSPPALGPVLRHLPWAVLLSGAAVSVALAAWVEHSARRELDRALEVQVQRFAQTLENQVSAYIDLLPGLRLFSTLEHSAQDAAFQNFVQTIALANRFPGLALTFVADRVRPSELEAYRHAVQSDRSGDRAGHVGATVFPVQPGEDAMALRHNHPASPALLGYNLFDPQQSYRAAIEAAVDSGGPVATPPLRLAADRALTWDLNVTAVVIRLASYRHSAVPATVDERRRDNRGVVGVAFRTQALVSRLVPADLLRAHRLRVIDLQAERTGQTSLLYDSHAQRPWSEPSPTAASNSVTLQVANRSWQLQLVPLDPAAWQGLQLSTLLLLAVGAALSGSLAVMTRLLVRSNQAAHRRIAQGTVELRTEQAHLAHSEQRFRLLYDQTFDAVLSTEPDGTVIGANPAACRLFGGSEAQLCSLGRAGLVDLQDPRLAELLAQRAATGYASGQLRMRRTDGSLFEADVSSSHVLDATGQGHTSIIVRDITERLALEARLRESQKLESIGTLAGGVAHDFNNVLTAILGNADFALQDLGPGDPVRASLARIRQAALRARDLVQQILTFSRRSPQELVVQSLGPLIEESVALLRSTLPATVRLGLSLPSTPLHALIDAGQVQQLVLNLCTNAWQALPQQTGQIEVSLRQHTITPAEAPALTLPPGRYACLQVSDNGCGMDALTQARIFDPFFTTKGIGEGTGLGLAVVHGIITASGGSIRVDSHPGQGSRFTLYLPQADASTVPAGASPLPAAPPPAPGEHVLYVDEDEVVALTVEMQLQRAGYRVTVMLDPLQVPARLAEPGCDVALVLTDFNMPGLSGLALARKVKQAHPALAVIISSGLVTDELLQQARAVDVFAVLQKEHSLERLLPLVKQALAAQTKG
jgi:PAS domain S-box-containing protein